MEHVIEIFVADHCPGCPDARRRVREFADTHANVTVVAQLVPMRKRRASPLGAMRGQFTMTEGWERTLTDEEAEAFWGGR